MIFTNQHGLFPCVLDGVVFSDDIGGAVNPNAVPSANRPDGVLMEFNDGTANTHTRTFGCTGNNVALCIDLGAIVGGQSSTFCGGDGVAVDLKRVLNEARCLERVRINSVTLDVDV